LRYLSRSKLRGIKPDFRINKTLSISPQYAVSIRETPVNNPHHRTAIPSGIMERIYTIVVNFSILDLFDNANLRFAAGYLLQETEYENNFTGVHPFDVYPVSFSFSGFFPEYSPGCPGPGSCPGGSGLASGRGRRGYGTSRSPGPFGGGGS
jgi:hypothetical protein